MSKQEATFYQIQNADKESKTAEILVYGSIPSLDEDDWKMKNTAERFVKDFKRLEKDHDRIDIHINSPGGSIYHGMPIFNVIRASKKEVHTYNDGLAASMGGVLLLAGHTIHSAKNSVMMLHNANVIAWGHAQELRDRAEVLDTYDDIIIATFADLSGKSKEYIKNTYFDYRDHWINAEKAKEEGFIHHIEDYEAKAEIPDGIENMSLQEVMAYYRPCMQGSEEKNFMQRVTDHVAKFFNIAPPTPAQATPNIHPNTDMDFKNSLALLAKEQLSAEDIAAIKAEITQFTGENEKFTSDEVNAQVTAAKAPLESEISNLKQEKANLSNEVSTLKQEKDTLTNEKATLSTEKETLEQENTNLKLDISAYRKSGVKPDNTGGDNPDQIDGEGGENLYCEADQEVKRLRQEAGIAE